LMLIRYLHWTFWGFWCILFSIWGVLISFCNVSCQKPQGIRSSHS
jgi:hypothetical protein